MAWDIYGNVLQRGHCEVHPNVPQEYPCYICQQESRQADERRRQEYEHRKEYEREMQREHEREQMQLQIASQQAEIDRLKELLDAVMGSQTVVDYHVNGVVASLKSERDTLKAKLSEMTDNFTAANFDAEQAEAEVERLKEAFDEYAKHRRDKGTATAKLNAWNHLVFQMESIKKP